MKKILFILFSLFGLVLTAQESYYAVEVKGDIGDAGCGTTKGLRHIKLIYTDNTIDTIFKGPNFDNSNFNYTFEIRDRKKIKTLSVYSKRQTKIFWDCKDSRYKDDTENINGRTCFYKRNDDAFGYTSGWYDFRITPIIILEEPSIESAFISSEDEINIGLPSNNVDLSHFNWQYKVANGLG